MAPNSGVLPPFGLDPLISGKFVCTCISPNPARGRRGTWCQLSVKTELHSSVLHARVRVRTTEVCATPTLFVRAPHLEQPLERDALSRRHCPLTKLLSTTPAWLRPPPL